MTLDPLKVCRIAYSTLLFFFFIRHRLVFRDCLVDRQHGGMVDAPTLFRRYQTVNLMNGLFGFWSFALIAFGLNFHPLFFGGMNWLFSYYFFILLRWKTLHRGLGVFGYFWWWMAGIFLLQDLFNYSNNENLSALITTARIDFGICIFFAAISKAFSGYWVGEGIEYGLANPIWGRFSHFFLRASWSKAICLSINRFIVLAQFAAGVGLICSSKGTTTICLALALCFLVSGLFLRLRELGPLLVIVLLLLSSATAPFPFASLFESQSWSIPTMLLAYLAIKAGLTAAMAVAFYGRVGIKNIPQKILDNAGWFLGLSLWRVFTREQLAFTVSIDPSNRQTHSDSALLDSLILTLCSCNLFLRPKYSLNAEETFQLMLKNMMVVFSKIGFKNPQLSYLRLQKDAKGQIRLVTLATFSEISTPSNQDCFPSSIQQIFDPSICRTCNTR